MFGINKKLKIHFIGIGGIGMSGIAEILHRQGYNVSGSDIAENANVKKLKEMGVEVFKGHHESNVNDVQIIVYSSAINYENPEIKKALNQNIPIIKRAEMLAELMRLKYGIAIAGSHGKTTTTSFVSTIFKNLDQKPTCIVGGIVKNLSGQAMQGEGQYLIAEADESDGSFLFLNPILSVITNIDNDHMDYYQTEDNIKKAFEDFANKVPFYGITVINCNDQNSVDLLSKLRRPYRTYAIEGKSLYEGEVDYLAKNVIHSEKGSEFTLNFQGEEHQVSITLAGDHNIQNALAAIAVSHKAGLELADICKAIGDFEGVGRRFEILHEEDGLVVVDDYGHHPTEILATIKTAVSRYEKKEVVVVFEPHRFSRTQEFWDEFIDCFNESVSKVYIAEIYPASEKPIKDIDSDRLVREINGKYYNAEKLKDWNQLKDIYSKYQNSNTVLLSMGAGSISKLTREKLEEWKS
jgi:UDP-N-acetylmuramate--alanine ligase